MLLSALDNWKYGVGTGQLEGEFVLSFIHLFFVDKVLERRQIKGNYFDK